jgi:hypothetical protein
MTDSNSGWPKDGEKWFCLTLAMQQQQNKDFMILPYPDEVRSAREDIGFSQERAARMVHVSVSAWRKWETHYDSDEYRQISGAAWELFIRKTDNLRSTNSLFKLREGI